MSFPPIEFKAREAITALTEHLQAAHEPALIRFLDAARGDAQPYNDRARVCGDLAQAFEDAAEFARRAEREWASLAN